MIFGQVVTLLYDIEPSPKWISAVKAVIPSGYTGVIHAKSGLVMEGIVNITGIIDEDFHGAQCD